MSVGLNDITVLQTMVKRRVHSLKQRAHLLCDYARIEDPSQETMEMLEAGEVTKRVTGLVTPATIVMVKNTVEAISVTYRPYLVSLPFLSMSSFHLGLLSLLVLPS